MGKKRKGEVNSTGCTWGWSYYYEIAMEYYREKGDLQVPFNYVTAEGVKLGSWISGQRKTHKGKRLSKEKVDLLEKIGMVWDPFDMKWNDFYRSAEAYYEENGNLLVPAKCITQDNKKLGLWISKQRALYKENKLVPNRIALLEKIGMIWHPVDMRWNEYYDQAADYYHDNGNLLVPQKYVTTEGIRLGYWINSQRKNYREKVLSKERIISLEKIGMVWDPADAQWNEYYNSLIAYCDAYGSSLVPLRYIDKENKQLGYWVSRQRSYNKSNKLSEKKKRLLEKVGMVWNPASMTWNEKYRIAKQYYNEYNNLRVSNSFFYKNINLGSWLQTQRCNYDKNLLDDNQIKRLNKIGMEWISTRSEDYIWERNYNTALEFFKKYKHLFIPTSYYSEDGVNIGRWLYDQKLKYKKDSLSEYKKNKLKLLDDSWLKPSNTKSSFPEHAVLFYVKKFFPTAMKLSMDTISEIDIYIRELKIGIEYDGPTHIRTVKKDIEKSRACEKQGIKLIRLRDCQCPIIKDNSYKITLEDTSFEALNAGIAELLDYLGVAAFEVDINKDYLAISDSYIKSIDLNWYNTYEKLEDYYRTYGNIDVPASFVTPDGIKLGRWISNMRQSVKNPSANGIRLNSNKIRLLDQLGMDWNPVETKWKRKYRLAEEYYYQNGNLLIPDKYITNDSIKLGRWIGTQRANYRKRKLSKRKTELLESIGMVWSLRR